MRLQWMIWTSHAMDPAMHALIMHMERLPPKQRSAAVVEQSRQDLLRRMALLDAQLPARDEATHLAPRVAAPPGPFELAIRLALRAAFTPAAEQPRQGARLSGSDQVRRPSEDVFPHGQPQRL